MWLVVRDSQLHSLMKSTGMKIVVEPSFVDGMPCGGQAYLGSSMHL